MGLLSAKNHPDTAKSCTGQTSFQQGNPVLKATRTNLGESQNPQGIWCHYPYTWHSLGQLLAHFTCCFSTNHKLYQMIDNERHQSTIHGFTSEPKTILKLLIPKPSKLNGLALEEGCRFNSTTQGLFLSQQPSDERKGMIL